MAYNLIQFQQGMSLPEFIQQTSLRRLLKVYPTYSIGRWVRRFKHDRDEQDFVTHLRRAGFPE